MDNSVLAWFLVMGLSGVLVGVIIGVFVASVLVRGNYTHFLSNQELVAPPVAPPVAPRQYVPRRDDYLYDERY